MALLPPAHADNLAAAEKFQLASRLQRGDGAPKNPQRALALYCEAALQGSSAAGNRAAWMYLNGIGVQRDPANGVAWLQFAAARGSADAARLLGIIGGSAEPKTPHCRIAIATVKAARSPAPTPIVDLVNKAARELALDPDLVLAVMATESDFQPNAVSPKNAKGLMQLTDATAKRFGVKDVFEPADNIRGGVRYLCWLLRYFDGDLARALAGYNAGEQAVVRYRGVPPYAETRAYIEKIGSRYPLDSLRRTAGLIAEHARSCLAGLPPDVPNRP